jgi:alkanesulfonate monooxygenase SsuD/methylene tetrahydromethanopterin reductase-like flavin-dependent oxidoreductase (luciferase family)
VKPTIVAEVRMRYAVGLPVMGEFGDPRVLVELAVAAEEAGWDGVFFQDHLLYRDGWPVADSTAVLAAAVALTHRVRLGVMVLPLARRRPAKVALELATLDRLSGGRLVFGAGTGSNPEEWSRFGENPEARVRGDRLDESLVAMTALWSGEEITFLGEHVTVDAVRMPLTPLQRPRIPVWCAARWPAPRQFRRAARWDGVMPTHRAYGRGETMPPEDLATAVAAVAEHRDPEAGPFDVVLEGRTAPGDGAGTVAPYAEAGLTWWVEALGWWRGGVAGARERVDAGPPTA